ncbi:hypothetical protein OEZ86_002072 [Tetradesmus obliquus]|nr:hypothetical protein OEZ86_002072 [Tetradesmus obliquus]
MKEESAVIGKGKIGSHDFMMFQYKIPLCPKQGHKHEWEQCVYAHRGERARRRHPSKYQAVQCPEARAKKVCPRADDCNCTHNLWEYWLHPDRYMTCLCELGPACNRPICFFAHEQHELRPLPPGLSNADDDMFPRPPRKERHQRNNTGSSNSSTGAGSSTHSSTQRLQQQAGEAGALMQQQQQQGGVGVGTAAADAAAAVWDGVYVTAADASAVLG